MPEEDAARAVLGADYWVANIPQRERAYRLEHDHPEGMELLRGDGYEGEVWMQCRALTEAESRERESLTMRMEAGSDAIHVDAQATFRYMLDCQVADARFAVPDGDGYKEYAWDKARGRKNKNYEVLDATMGPGLRAWIQSVLRRANFEEEDQSELLDETGKCLPAAES